MRSHGGDIYRALGARREGVEILDYSASINPLGMPEAGRRAYEESIPWLVHYPDPESAELRDAIARHHDLPKDSILCGNGSTELISLMPRALGLRKVLTLAPTFSEYERAVSLAGGEVISFVLDPAADFDPDEKAIIAKLESADSAILCNPNNPTGRVLDKETMLRIARFCEEREKVLIVDETFGDFCPGRSIVSEAAKSRWLISLRSFTKFYGMPGIRLGYMVAHPSVVARAGEYQDTWSVGVTAQRVGAAVLSDTDFAKETLLLVEMERAYLEEGLRKTGWLTPLSSAANFILVRIDHACGVTVNSDALCAKTAAGGVLLRNCRSFLGLGDRYVRVAVKTRAENERLMAILQHITF